MHAFLLIVSTLFLLVGLVCGILVIKEAFYDELWMGLLAFFVPIYFLYYAIFEFEHEKKWQILAGALGGVFLAALFFELAMGVPVVRPGSFTGFG